MLAVLATTCVVLSLATAVWVVVEAVRNRRPGWFTLGGMAAAELVALAATGLGVWHWAQGTAGGDTGLVWGYAACCVGVLPLAFFWGVGEKSMWGNLVMAIGLVTEAVLMLRVADLF